MQDGPGRFGLGLLFVWLWSATQDIDSCETQHNLAAPYAIQRARIEWLARFMIASQFGARRNGAAPEGGNS
jgi:hypothetical protein